MFCPSFWNACFVLLQGGKVRASSAALFRLYGQLFKLESKYWIPDFTAGATNGVEVGRGGTIAVTGNPAIAFNANPYAVLRLKSMINLEANTRAVSDLKNNLGKAGMSIVFNSSGQYEAPISQRNFFCEKICSWMYRHCSSPKTKTICFIILRTIRARFQM
ncbi:MAG: hypothetical protein LBI30_03730 [Holosporales bacterium]|jgi:hypothetical protein|nr:hypothetical protein [Holosporales bacterium]